MSTHFHVLTIILVALIARPAVAEIIPTPPPPPGTLFFDYFLADNLGQPAENFNNFLLWNVTDGSVDLVGGNVPGADDLPDGRFVDLGGSTGDPGQFSSRLAIPLLAGQTYNLFFEYRSTDGSPNTAEVTFAGQTFSVSSSSTAFQSFSQDLVIGNAVTSSPIVFQDFGADTSGIGIDAVLVRQVVAVPEPSSVAALVALGCSHLIRRCKRKA